MQPAARSAVSHASQLSPALIVARTELAEAEAHIAEAQATIDEAPAISTATYRLALARRSYYGQLALRYRGEVARLLREQGKSGKRKAER